MSRILLNGSPRTAARQLIELLTRDGILDEDGNVRPDTVEAACRYAGRSEPEGEQSPKSPSAIHGSTASNKSETPDAKSEPCTPEAASPRDDTSRIHSPKNS